MESDWAGIYSALKDFSRRQAELFIILESKVWLRFMRRRWMRTAT